MGVIERELAVSLGLPEDATPDEIAAARQGDVEIERLLELNIGEDLLRKLAAGRGVIVLAGETDGPPEVYSFGGSRKMEAPTLLKIAAKKVEEGLGA